jgi:hypothetical protein
VKARVQVYQLVQAVILLANHHNVTNAVIPISVAGTSVNVAIKVIEPPLFVAIGDPAQATAEAFLPINSSPNRIYVQSAKLRLHLSVSLSSGLSSVVSGLTTAVTNLASPLVSILNSLLSLNLGDLLSTLLGGTRDYLDIQLVPAPLRFDVNLDVVGGNARVTNYHCQDHSKSLTVPTNTSAATVRIGKMGTSAADARNQVMSSLGAPAISPVALVDFGKKQCSVFLGLISSCNTRVPFAAGGIGLMTDVTLLAPPTTTLLFESPDEASLPELNIQGIFKSVSSQQLISSLASTLAGLNIVTYQANGSALGTTVMLVGSVIDTVVGLLKTAISSVLSPLLDPLVTLLLENVGIDLAKTEVAANLSCDAKQGVMLMR